ncbi:YrhK-like protein [Breoghania corrubedonensis]|uniref:YrhK-like protein n=1 Tax=Breoghania corrubedonensis TaxID=665038 RepID=A0A2T5V9H0_9HYPH|nr:YrhK family protein [Breoghania corrubedonensis]PTW60388.1 YrhK-like protein [Breoghania corrubedonensis]
MATLFNHENRTRTRAHARTTTRYEIARTAVEFAAALAFIVGSVFFFYNSLKYLGTWLFVVGSVLFAVRPAVRLAMEIHLVTLPCGDGTKE